MASRSEQVSRGIAAPRYLRPTPRAAPRCTARCAAPFEIFGTGRARAVQFFFLPRGRLDDAGIITRKEEEKPKKKKKRKNTGALSIGDG